MAIGDLSAPSHTKRLINLLALQQGTCQRPASILTPENLAFNRRDLCACAVSTLRRVMLSTRSTEIWSERSWVNNLYVYNKVWTGQRMGLLPSRVRTGTSSSRHEYPSASISSKGQDYQWVLPDRWLITLTGHSKWYKYTASLFTCCETVSSSARMISKRTLRVGGGVASGGAAVEALR
jgi:hypothetical protein